MCIYTKTYTVYIEIDNWSIIISPLYQTIPHLKKYCTYKEI